MKHLAHLSLSTLLVSATSTATTHLRGDSSHDEQDISAPPRLFEEHSLDQIIEPQSSLGLASATHDDDDQDRRDLQTINNCNSNEHSLSISLTSDKHSNTDNKFTISTKEDETTTTTNNNNNNRWNSLHATSGELNEPITMCISPNHRYRFEALDSYSDGIVDGYYEVRLDGVKIFRTPGGRWSRSVHKFNVGEEVEDGIVAGDKSDVEADAEEIEEKTEEELEEELEGFELKMGTGFPTSVAVMTTPPNPAPATPKPTKKPPSSGDSAPTAAKPTPRPAPPAAKPEPAPVTTSATVSMGVMTEREHQWLDEHNVRREI